MLRTATVHAFPGVTIIQSGLVLAFGLLLGWWVRALVKRLGKQDDPFSIDSEGRRPKAPLFPSPARGRWSGSGRRWLASAQGLVSRRWSSAPKAALALVVLGLITTLPPAYALGSAPSAPATTSSWEVVAVAPSVEVTPAPSPSDTPSPSDSPLPSPSPSDIPAQPPASEPSAPIISWPAVAPLRPTPPPPPPLPVPTPTPPTVILTASPLSGLAPLTVFADASRSTSSNGIASYEFDFGNGIVIRPILGASASYKYCVGGVYRLKVTVTDKAGLSSSAFLYVQVIKPVNPVIC